MGHPTNETINEWDKMFLAENFGWKGWFQLDAAVKVMNGR